MDARSVGRRQDKRASYLWVEQVLRSYYLSGFGGHAPAVRPMRTTSHGTSPGGDPCRTIQHVHAVMWEPADHTDPTRFEFAWSRDQVEADAANDCSRVTELPHGPLGDLPPTDGDFASDEGLSAHCDILGIGCATRPRP
jgi:hypothetical protein